MTPPLRRTRGDLVATGIIAAVSAVAVAAAVATAPIRSAELTPAAGELADEGKLAAAPAALSETFRLPDDSPGRRPLVAEGLLITHSGTTLTATTAEGETAWTYERDAALCSLSQAWGKVVATYRAPAGCGDVVAIEALTGHYAGTRSAPAPEQVAGLSSNDKVGYSSSTRTELWRSDLVRTVEYGAVEAPQEAGMQPHQCTQTSALTRTELLAVTESCGDGSFLRLQSTTPKDSREPDIHASVPIPDGAYLVAVGQQAAAVYDPAAATVSSYDKQGRALASAPAPGLGEGETIDATLHVPANADLPHHMTYFSGGRLLLFSPTELRLTATIGDALGTGVAAGDRLLYATERGVAVANWDTGETETVIPVDRAGYAGPVFVDSAGAGVVEKRGSELVYLAAN
ncbi:hypothetical protein [Corynebacterium senegalense]|uniref:Rv3212 family protein n=1 Tax=Corynebacterium senegalense TaxID=2080750 RepID=UPI000E200B8C|nr:hypothetical protein [Corynebacterium senegalense]